MNTPTSANDPSVKSKRGLNPILLFSVFVIATCGILYELLLSSISSFFLGNSILQFSLTIGVFMFFMGIGSYISKYMETRLVEKFINIEVLLGFLGGISSTTLYIVYSYTQFYYLYYFLFISLLGILVGIEIPVVVRIINRNASLKDTVAQVLSFDYVGALVASLVFPLILLPKLGLINTAYLIGNLNLLIALGNAWYFRKVLRYWKPQALVAGFLVILFSGAGYYSNSYISKFEQKVFQDKIVFKQRTPYQHIILTRWKDDYRMYINGAIQFSSKDEYRYHESLVHVPLSLCPIREKVLILGGGDGMTAREVLKYKDVKQVNVVDLDSAITNLAMEDRIFLQLNDSSFLDPRVTITNEDAYKFLERSGDRYNLIILDLPDPNDPSVGKMYTREFYNIVQSRLERTGYVVTQATSPYFAPKAYWCINNTVKSVFGETIPYNVDVPSFGASWGFVMAGNMVRVDSTGAIDKQYIQQRVGSELDEHQVSPELRYLTRDQIPAMLTFDQDMKYIETEVNSLNGQVLLQYYSSSADNWR